MPLVMENQMPPVTQSSQHPDAFLLPKVGLTVTHSKITPPTDVQDVMIFAEHAKSWKHWMTFCISLKTVNALRSTEAYGFCCRHSCSEFFTPTSLLGTSYLQWLLDDIVPTI